MEELAVERDKGLCRIQLSGLLDRRLAMLMREEMSRQAEAPEIKEIILDLAGVTRIDSMGVGMLVSAFRSCQSRNMGFALVGVMNAASEVIRITGLDAILPIYADAAAARKALYAPPKFPAAHSAAPPATAPAAPSAAPLISPIG